RCCCSAVTSIAPSVYNRPKGRQFVARNWHVPDVTPRQQPFTEREKHEILVGSSDEKSSMLAKPAILR
ncbi:MAG: hypothetical protein RR517_31930, partial [Pseudomonas sp.]